MVIQPETVNFHNIVVREIDSAAVKTGIFDDGNTHCHIKGIQPKGKPCDGQSHIAQISLGSPILNASMQNDFVGGGENDPEKIKKLPARSSAIFSIPMQWKLASEPKTAWRNFPRPIKQSLVLLKNGDMTVSKENYVKTVKINDNHTELKI